MEQKKMLSSSTEVRDEDVSSSKALKQSSVDLAPQSTHAYREKMRTILAIGTVFLLFLVLLAYIVTREVAVLGIGTIFVTACAGVMYRHYFPGENR